MHLNAKKYILLLLLSTLKVVPNPAASPNQSVIDSLTVIKAIASLFEKVSKKSWFFHTDPSQNEINDALTLNESNSKLAHQFPFIKDLKTEIDLIADGKASLNEGSFLNCRTNVRDGYYSSNEKLEKILLCLKANTTNANQKTPALHNESIIKHLQLNNNIAYAFSFNDSLSKQEVSDALTIQQNPPASNIPELNILQKLSTEIAYGKKDINLKNFQNCCQSIIENASFSTNTKLTHILRCVRANSTDIPHAK